MVINLTEEHPKKLLRAKDCAAFFGIGVSTWWRWQAEGRIPPGIRLTRRTTVWNFADILDFIEKQAADDAKG